MFTIIFKKAVDILQEKISLEAKEFPQKTEKILNMTKEFEINDYLRWFIAYHNNYYAIPFGKYPNKDYYLFLLYNFSKNTFFQLDNKIRLLIFLL